MDWRWDPNLNQWIAFDHHARRWIYQAEYSRSHQHLQNQAYRAPVDQAGILQSGESSSSHGTGLRMADGSSHIGGSQALQSGNPQSPCSDTADLEPFTNQLNELSLVDKPTILPSSEFHNAVDVAQVQSTTRAGPPQEITDPVLYEKGIAAHKQLCATEGDEEKLFPKFKKRAKPADFFRFGKVFKVLWAEPAGDTIVTSRERPLSISRSRFGEEVHSKVRRFVVIKAGNRYCSALPITTYNGKGVTKKGVIKSHHSVIYIGKSPPEIKPTERPQASEELPMQNTPIRVLPDEKAEKLDPMSRLDYNKIYTVEHYVKVQALGMVHEPHKRILLEQFNNVWNTTLPMPAEPEHAQDDSEADLAETDGTQIDREALIHILEGHGYSRDEVVHFLDARKPPAENHDSTDVPSGSATAANPTQSDGFCLSPTLRSTGNSTQHQPRVTSNEAQSQSHETKEDATFQVLRKQGVSARQANAALGKRRVH